jgi:hypothetical protein
MSHIFAYSQGKGLFFNSNLDKVDKTAFSGDFKHSNNEEFSSLKNSGPIPVGTYTIEKLNKYEKMGYLKPDPDNEMFDREEMMIHVGNNIVNHNSHGCIIIQNAFFDNLDTGDSIEVTNDM